MEPANELALQVKGILGPFLGKFDNGTRAAWSATPSSGALVNEGLAAGTTVSGLEAVFALFPSDKNDLPEFAQGLSGVLYFQLVMKMWGEGSTFPARQAIEAAFPLMSTRLGLRPRFSPATDISIETLSLFIPQQY